MIDHPWWKVDPPWLVLVPAGLCSFLITLRLEHVINWQWWVVVSPLWGAFLLFGLAVAFFGIVLGLAWKD